MRNRKSVAGVCSSSSARRRTLLVGTALLIAMARVSAQPAEPDWDSAGNFERLLPVAPGKFAELCAKMTTGQSIAWAFQSPVPLNFNIHYHEGKKVVYPVRQDDAASLEGSLQATVVQTYCWMWENKSAAAATIAVVLRRR